jgi:hypothetical protein
MLPFRPMPPTYPSAPLDAELDYRREVLMTSARNARTRRRSWFHNPRRSR